jgi:hypothetical protein
MRFMSRLIGARSRAASTKQSTGAFGRYLDAAEFVREWLFEPRFYMANSPMATLLPTASPAHLWTHFVEEGQYQGLSPSPFLDVAFARRTAVARGCDGTQDLFNVWKELGVRFTPGPMFDPTHYLIRNPDVLLAGLDPFFHWAMYGIFEGRSPSPWLIAHGFNDPGAPDAERREKIHAVPSLGSFLAACSAISAVNLAAMRDGFPHLDPFEGLASGAIPFCTDPQILFGDVTAVLIRAPRQLDNLDTGGA